MRLLYSNPPLLFPAMSCVCTRRVGSICCCAVWQFICVCAICAFWLGCGGTNELEAEPCDGPWIEENEAFVVLAAEASGSDTANGSSILELISLLFMNH